MPTMTTASRRTFLAATGTGAAAAAALTAAPTTHASPPDATPEVRGREPHLVAYIQDASTGQVTLLTGEDEVVVHDPALVRLLTQAARR
jgi:hypothetical protein